jgi:DEAD/DEAH box helicase domain-containing protein
LEKALDRIIEENNFAPFIAEDRLIPAGQGNYAPFPADLDARLAENLRRRGLSRLYAHQTAAWEAVRSGGNLIAVTPTASGKTLCYNLPVLNALLADQTARALYLFPTKALSQDQQAELNAIIQGNPPVPIKALTYDGDTQPDLRVTARDAGRIIISNPDMLHDGVLPNHTKWIKFFSNLKFIVIDEAHTYRGVFGSHVANVIRRLKRVAAFYASTPRFILCSATIANPQELAEALIGEPVTLISENGAPRGEKRVILYNPPLIDAVQGVRAQAVMESRRWMLAFLRAGVKTILFAHSRIKTEVIASAVNEDLKNIYTNNSGVRVEAYRSGLLPSERREIERGLREGTVQGVVSTNALELGIDIGGLDAAIVVGFPGSFSSFWQQTGRAGRRGGLSAAVFIANASPLDQFIMQNPDWFFRKPVEQALINPDNPYIFADHIKCAAFELPFRDQTGKLKNNSGTFFGADTGDALAFLEENGVLRHTGGAWYWADRSYPAGNISLRSAMSENVVIIDATAGLNRVIGEMDRPSAKELIFKNAVYIHRGKQYIVKDLDLASRKCLVEESNTNYYTDGFVKTDVRMLSEDQHFEHTTFRACLGDALVRSQASSFKKIRFDTQEIVGYGVIDLPEEETHTRALILLFPPDQGGGELLGSFTGEEASAILYGAGKLLKQVAPLFLLCDSRDLGVSAKARDPHFGAPALYLYDRYPGGTGLAEALSEQTPALFRASYGALKACPCERGCPSCAGAGENKAGIAKFLGALSGDLK